MTYLIIFLFALNGDPATIYLGEVKSEAACYKQARETIPVILPGVKQGMILCVQKQET